MRFATSQLAFKAGVSILRTVRLHGGPVTLGLQELKHFLSTDMVVLNVKFLHDQKLIAKGCKVEPQIAMPRHQLTI